jgi:hypothetical protein
LLYVGTPIVTAAVTISVWGTLVYLNPPPMPGAKAGLLTLIGLNAVLAAAGPAYSGLLVGRTRGIQIGIALARGAAGFVVHAVLIVAVPLFCSALFGWPR